jgi:pimeloyl-ACP methyl ester carboxylesterase
MHGDSEDDGFISLVKISEDILSAISCIEGRSDVDDSHIGFVGHSIGGAGGIVAASKDPRIRCLVTISAFSDPVELTGLYLKRYRIPRWPFLWLIRQFIEAEVGIKMAEVAPENCIGRVTVPALLIHGDADRFIPPSNMEDILSKSRREHAEGWLVPGRRHADVFLDPGFAPRVTDFLRNGLSREPLDGSAERSS